MIHDTILDDSLMLPSSFTTLRTAGLLVLTTLCLYAILRLLFSRSATNTALPYPPGPRPLPLIGNLLNVPRSNPHKYYATWKKSYGDISYMRIFGRQFVMLNSAKAALDLFERRSAIYSSRPQLIMAGELVGRDKSLLFTPYGDRFRATKKLIHPFLSPAACRKHHDVQEEEAAKFVGRLLTSPENFVEHAKSTAGAVIFKLVYGHQVQYDNDPYVNLAASLSRITSEASAPGKWMVDSFPLLRHAPDWCGFQRWASRAKRDALRFTKAPHDLVKSSMMQGKEDIRPSFTSDILSAYPDGIDAKSEELLMYASASIANGGSDTVSSVVVLFFLIMALHPWIQRKLQEEVDAVVGDGRVPNMSDFDNMPYMQCVIKELHRYNPVIPLVPHSPVQDDVYEGYVVPKGAWVMANVWAITHDPEVYYAPDEFHPERFEGPNAAPDPTVFTFGLGRRACPGSQFATASLFLSLSHTVWALDLSLPRNGNAPRKVEFVTGHASHPVTFPVDIKSRSTERSSVLKEALAI